MNDNNIPIVEPIVDYTKIPPIHQRRTISFINHFIVTTVAFLNKFSLKCEEKLYEFENKLQKLEAAVVILESRLASVPGLENKSTVAVDCDDAQSSNTVEKENDSESIVNAEDVTTQNLDETKSSEVTTVENVEPISKHPLYEKYFKMVNFGVPKPAVKIKMAQEGLDPSLLDDPQQLIPKESPSGVEE
ncbi:hypothetical protein PV328_008785 [Microctonus aethiopoides]|uniref:WASH complex subunit 3 n=1 Tax=Microctonus aethiopoides TaxID=144406 RepID=A0AA39FK03_9HYME|nr:hypothetical protein PV328_008785 [Microctonus aethiopoides]